MNQVYDCPSTILNNLWVDLIAICMKALNQSPDEWEIALLNFWAYRGGGKTTFLHGASTILTDLGNVVVLGLWDVAAISLGKLIEDISHAVEAATQPRKIVLLDNLDALLHLDDGETFFEFERQLVLELLERKDVLLIATSQIPISTQWRQYDVRIHQESRPIPALSKHEVTQIAEAWAVDADRLFTLSQGYPQVLAWLRERPDITSTELASRIKDYFLGCLPISTRELAFITSLLPWFDIAVLRDTKSTQQEDTEEGGFYAGYVEHLRQWISIGLIMWDMQMGAYRFCNSAVRRLLAWSFQTLQPLEFARIHSQAAAYYQAESKRAGYLHYTLISALYHLAQTQFTKDPQTVGNNCLKWVNASLEMWTGADWEAVVEAWRGGAGDKSVKEELENLLGSQTVEDLTDLLEGTKFTMEVKSEYANTPLD